MLGTVLFSALLISAALPNEVFHYGNPILGLVCIVPFLYGVSRSPTIRFTILLGAVFGGVSTGVTYFWLLFFQDFSVWTISGVVFAHTLYFVLFAPIFRGLYLRNGRMRPFLIAAAWVAYEYFKSNGYIGFPWGLLAMPVGMILPLCQIADITGVWGVSYLVAAINAVLAEVLLSHDVSMGLSSRVSGKYPQEISLRFIEANRETIPGLRGTMGDSNTRRYATSIIVICIAVVGYGTARLVAPESYDRELRLIMVQQNVDSWRRGKEALGLQRGQELTREALDMAKVPPHLVTWSENSLRRPFTEYQGYFNVTPEGDPFLSFLREIHLPLLTGAPYAIDLKERKIMNGAVLLSPEGRVESYYGKTHAVPLAEHIPFWENTLVQTFFRNVIGLTSGGWTLGSDLTVFSVTVDDGSDVRFCTPICFEDSFPDLCRRMIASGADLLINLTNDSWSKTVSGETQHFAAARFRAIENRRPLVRSTNAGVTTIIDAKGRITYSLRLYEADTLYGRVRLNSERPDTAYSSLGDYFPIFLAVVVLCVLITRSPGDSTRRRLSQIFYNKQ